LRPDAPGSDDKVGHDSVVAERAHVSLVVVRMSRQDGMRPDACRRAAIVDILEHIRIAGVTKATFLESAGIRWVMDGQEKSSHRSLALLLDRLECISKPGFFADRCPEYPDGRWRRNSRQYCCRGR